MGPEFEPNAGQADQRYLFLARAGATRAYVEDRGFAFATSSGMPVRLTWVDGASSGEKGRGVWRISEATGNTNFYCVQNKSSVCTDGVGTYRRLIRTDLYPGIDWVLHGRGGQLEYDLVVHPGARLDGVRLRVDGAPAEVAADGRLRAGDLLHWRPEAYQVIDGRRVPVEAALRSSGDGAFEFVTGAYDAGHDLVIDPVVETLAVAGGGDEDAIQGSVTGGSCSFRYGTTRSGEWDGLGATSSRHVFVQMTRAGLGTSTYFWGGEGEESIGGADAEPGNCLLYLVGWTTSQNAPGVSSLYERQTVRPYAGGASDGFLLKFSWSGLGFASYLGGPGADRLYDVRLTSVPGYDETIEFAGETDDPAWAGALVRKIGGGGRADAIAGSLGATSLSLLAIGGAGDDRMMRLRPSGDGGWVMAGETDSPDFPVRAGTADAAQAAAGRDLWVGGVGLDLDEAPVLRTFGGSGDERFGGLAVLPAQGVYLAGTTTSTDLPAAEGAYHGGDSDGFVAFFDPLTAAVQTTTYLGGSGRDEILAADGRDGSVFLGGTTDSDDLVLPGLAAGEDAHGGLDALFVLADAFGTPTRGIRLGGGADDRVLGVEPGDLGKVILAGSSDSREWLDALDPLHPESSGQDGFLARVSFAAVRVRGFSSDTPGTVYAGRDLQVYLTVESTSEEGMDGMLRVRSGDPSRLLVSPRSDLPGRGEVLLENTDRAIPYSSATGSSFVLQGLADSGEVEVVVEGRTEGASKGLYPRQRIRVRLTPTGLFLSSEKDVSVAVNGTVDVVFAHAPLLPDGRSGPAEALRAGVTAAPGLIPSDAAGLQVLRDSIRQGDGTGGYRVTVRALQVGTYTATPSFPQFGAAPGEFVTIRVDGSATAKLFPDRPYVLAKDHYTMLSLNGLAGDELLFTSDDPSRVVVGRDRDAWAGTVSLTNPSGSLVIAALAGEGTATVRVEGTYQGRPISQSLLVYLVPYKATLLSLPAVVGTGVLIYPQVQLEPQTAGTGAVNAVVPNMMPRPAALMSVQLRSSNPAVLRVAQRASDSLSFMVVAGVPGEAVLDFGDDAPAELAEIRAVVQVVPAHLNFGMPVIRIPAGSVVNLYPSMGGATAGPDSYKAVWLRVSGAAPVTLSRWGQTATEMMVDFSGGYGVSLSAEAAQPGQQATLSIAAANIPQYALPIRIVEPVLLPQVSEMEVAPADGKPAAGTAMFDPGGYDEGLVVPAEAGRLYAASARTVRVKLNPPGICEGPDLIETSAGGVSVPFTCTSTGTTVLSLEPVSGLTAAQPQFTVRIVSRPSVPVALPVPSRVMTGNGLQARLSLTEADRLAGATITSSDPERVRLSLDPKAPGSAQITTPASAFDGAVYVQGYAPEGTATLTVEAADGRRGEVKVFLFASTLALRPPAASSFGTTDQTLTVDQPLSSTDLALTLRPALVDPASGKLLWGSGLSIRGGTDPAFVRAQSADSSIAEPALPDALLSEGDATASLKFRVKATGDVVLSGTQPEGFAEVPESLLRVHVYEKQLAFSTTPVLSADLQIPISVVASGGDRSSSVNATMTSLDPDKLLISSDGAASGEASLTGPLGKPVYLQALSGAAPGTTARVRLEAPGYSSTEQEVRFAAAELQLAYPDSLRALRPLVSSSIDLRYGPVDEGGKRVSQFSGSFRPGVRLPVRVSTSDSNIVGIAEPDLTLDTYLAIGLLAVAPGQAQVLVEAPAQITNRAATIDAVVGPFEFGSISVNSLVRFLVTKFTVTNPRPQPTEVSVSSNGNVPLWFGTAASGAEAPAAPSLLVSLGANETRTLYVEPAGAGTSGSIHLEAPEFAPASSGPYLSEPQVRIEPGSLLNVSLSNGTSQIAIVLGDGNRSSSGLPLGAAFGPLRIQLESSNPQVVRVPAAPVEFAAGDSRKNAVLELVGTGDAVVSLTVPAGFSSAAPVRQVLVVSVR